MKKRVTLLLASLLFISGLGLTMVACEKEETPPMPGTPDSDDYNKSPSEQDG